jgi:hypothetical protein
LTDDKLKIVQLMRHDKIDETGELGKLCQRHVADHAAGGAAEDTSDDFIMHELGQAISDKYQRYQAKMEKEAEAKEIEAGDEGDAEDWMWNGIIMEAKIRDIKKVGKKCLDILHSALRKLMEINSEITGETNLEMTAYDYSKEGSLVKAYESIGFINTGRNIFS